MKITIAAIGMISAAAYYTYKEQKTDTTSQVDNQFTKIDLQEFTSYLAKYGKSYDSIEEFSTRANLYLESRARVEAHNS